VWTGAGLSVAVGVSLSWTWEPLPAAVAGLLSGTAVFAAATSLAAHHVFRRFDTSYYRAF
jgi:hypothetical protein